MLGRTPVSLIVFCAISAITFLRAAESHADYMATFATGGYARGVQIEAMMQNIDADHDGKIKLRVHE